jgi:transcription initiation factor IIF auxiliary subunit
MALKLRNRWKYLGDQDDNCWEWEAFLDDLGTGELADVAVVEYVLPSTFPNPLRVVEDPQGGFALKTAGWGDFTLKAFVNLKNGKRRKLIHKLELKEDPLMGVSA